MNASLPKTELWIYWSVWLYGVFYSIYNVYLSGMTLKLHNQQELFSSGWSLLKRKKDVSDYEWILWTDFLYKASPWFISNSIGSEIIRWMYKQAIPLWYLFISVWFLLANLGMWPTLLFILVPCIMYIISLRKNKYLIWGFVLVGMAVLSFEQITMDVPDYWQYFFTASQSWMLIRCVAFSMERINVKLTSVSAEELMILLSYCLYFPTLFLGPIIGYKEFHDGVTKSFSLLTMHHYVLLVVNCLRYLGWWIFTDVASHFIYSSALMMNPQIVEELGAWSLYGMGYCMGQYFMLKYVVVYGLMSTVARAEHIDAPHHPKCIARICLYSDMWRSFDQGLYLFLKRYIYVPSLGRNPCLCRKLASSFLCFCFIFLWHKPYLSIFVWSFLNFTGIAIEKICKAISESAIYSYWENLFLHNQHNRRRFYSFICTPLFLMSALSNFYFFGDLEIGNIFVRRLFGGSYSVNATLFVFAYCCCQVSIEVSNML